ncbi:cytochrome ubiquinol oxidase subunit I [Dactylosporangium sp. CA-092794]|uniref:cytochrome ubiquinol oxidase subunit I n=1 Tax=Dactylosporangium sp. CA-092794 TaxID=3239929 RepID=UPI003D921B96
MDPPQLLPAREQMAFTLGFHIILVPFGMAFTFFMLLANYRGLRHADAAALLLARRWSHVAAVLFAVGAVSGTVLSFELGLLWPRLMGTYGSAFGIPFAIEGLFFFLEAIFIAVYIYGWDRLSGWAHFWTGVPVVVAGIGGTLSVVAANAWMNQPGGFTMREGRVTGVQPLRVIFNGAFWYESLHMLLAGYMVAGFLTAAVYAGGRLRRRATPAAEPGDEPSRPGRTGQAERMARLGLLIPLTVAAILTPLQIVVGDIAAREVFHREPAKFAAIEGVPHTDTHVPEVLGGLYSDGRLRFGIPIPSGASLLSGYSPATRIRGLDEIPPEVRPSDREITVVHLAFDAMVGAGTFLLLLSAWYALAWWRRRDLPRTRWFARATVAGGVLSVVALEAGWVVTEVGRQPWTVVGHLLTRDAVTRAGNVWLFFIAILVLYAAVGATTVHVLRLLRHRWRERDAADVDVPYGPTHDESADASEPA